MITDFNMPESKVPFGKPFRQKYFAKLDPNVINVNHGSFGLTPDPIFKSYMKNIEKQNLFPEKTLRFDDRNDYIKALKLVADKELLNCDFHNLALLENATLAVNAVLRSYPFVKGDKIVIASTTYKACANTVNFLEKRIGIELIVIELNFPLTNSEILELFRREFEQNSPKLCLFDTVSSLPSIRFPFEQIIDLCREYEVLSLVDGAHGIGLVELSLEDLRPDFLITNLHKWFYIQIGCAILYVDSKHQRKIHSIPISHSYLDDDEVLESEELNNMRFINTFQFTGTTNKANIPTIEEAINFRKDICGGESVIRRYCEDLSHQVVEVFTKTIWPNTTYLDNEDDSAITAMVNIQVPIEQYYTEDFDRNELKDCLLYLEEHICFKYNTFVPFCINNEKVYARFSCQLYNDIDNYIYAGEAILKALKEFFENKIYNDLKASARSGAIFLAVEKLSSN